MTDVNADIQFMLRALELARRGEGLTRPNPPVGAVIVRGGKVVGEGFHRKAGTAHAEIVALKQAGSKARGATLYVTLEPCSTFGRTPPCVDAIVAAGIRRVVAAIKDPNPKHAGRGLALLRRERIAVTAGVCEYEAAEIIAPFAKWICTRRPYVTLKLAISLDGRIADREGVSQWITGAAARKRVHELRRKADGIMVGSGTVLADNPSLTPRPAKGRAPFRIIVGPIPRKSRLLTDAARDRTLVVSSGTGKAVSLTRLMDRLGEMNLLHVVCEGGGKLAESLVRAGLVDEFWFFLAPVLIGGPTGAIGGEGWLLPEAPRLRFIGWEHVGDDLLIKAVAR
jgi:diaminohydroxyphosphoribosylaminopyrimidine deaminase/5-amino-6-(5-phosphoribosylamino)uracil reductase